jgi:1-acyl-sn-glycerol-3-phosphate acyltransferase
MSAASSVEARRPAYHVPRRTLAARAVMRPAFRLLLRILSPIHISGVENVPRSGAYIIAINHVSLYEAPFIVAFWPVAVEAAGAADIWNRKGQSLLVRLYGGIPVHRGEYDRRLFETMQAVLASGRPLLIAPEGGRSHTPGMQPALPGIGFLIEKTGAPVVPVGITGATDDYLQRALRGERPPLAMNIGAPLRFSTPKAAGDTRRTHRQQAVDRVMTAIAALLPSEYRGVYADHVQRTA